MTLLTYNIVPYEYMCMNVFNLEHKLLCRDALANNV